MSANSKTYILDLWKNKSPSINLKQMDSDRALMFNIQNNGVNHDLTGHTAKYYVKKNDGTIAYNDAYIINAVNGLIKCSLTEQVLTVLGILEMEIQIISDDGAVSTFSIYINVTETIIDANAVQSSSEFNALVNALSNVNNIDQSFNNVSNEITQTNLDKTNIYGTPVKSVVTEIKTASVSIMFNVESAGSQVYSNLTWFGQVFDRLKLQGLGATIVTIHNIPTSTSSTFEHLTRSQITAILDLAAQKGVEIKMLKPHIGIDYGDGLNRSAYNPTDKTAFFTNWTNELLFMAEIANAYNIPWLSVSCEQYQLTTNTNHYYSNWQTLVNTIRTAYPNLKLTGAFTATELTESVSDLKADSTNLSLLNLLDAIGLNFYGNYVSEYYPNFTLEDIEKAMYYDQFNAPSIFYILRDTYDTFRKPCIVTEFGCLYNTGALIDLTGHNSGVTDRNCQALLFQAMFNTIIPLPFVIGFCIWHVWLPFQYFDFAGASIYPGEQVVIDYTAKGAI